MTRRRPSTTAKTFSHGAEPQHTMLVHSSRERLRSLLQERERLMREVQKKKLELERMVAEVQQSAHAMLEKLAPLIARHEALSLEAGQLFDELLTPGRLSANARKKVARIRRMLVNEGMLDEFADEPHGDVMHTDDENDNPFGPDPGEAFGHTRDVASAAPRGQGTGHDALRGLFKRLVLTVHPDRAAHEPDRELRTAAMKQVTQAYNDGDLARLLELEKAWRESSALDSGGDEEAQCRNVERIIGELRSQATQLGRELRETKKLVPSELMGGSMNTMIALAQADLNEFEKMRDFVKSFRDGKITLAQFVRGPAVSHHEEIDLEALMYDLVGKHVAKQRPQTPKGRRTSG